MHRARKKRYCSRIGWADSQPELAVSAPSLASPVLFCPAAVLFVRSASAEGNGGSGGGGERGRAGEEGVAFSMRAQVRYTSNNNSKVPSRIIEGCFGIRALLIMGARSTYVEAIIFSAKAVE